VISKVGEVAIMRTSNFTLPHCRTQKRGCHIVRGKIQAGNSVAITLLAKLMPAGNFLFLQSRASFKLLWGLYFYQNAQTHKSQVSASNCQA